MKKILLPVTFIVLLGCWPLADRLKRRHAAPTATAQPLPTKTPFPTATPTATPAPIGVFASGALPEAFPHKSMK